MILKNCLVCGNPELKEIYNLGLQPLINNLKTTPNSEELKFPIVVNSCPKCTHQQLSIAVDPELLFKNYLYTTGTSESHIEYFRQFAVMVKGRSVLDIGCNDGSLLKCFQKIGCHVLGIDPAKNFEVDGIDIIKDFFPSKQIKSRKFDIITAFNVFAHNSNPREFLSAVAGHLTEKGRIYIQTTITNLGCFYHEHVSYFNPLSMFNLADQCGLECKSFKIVSMHKESYLFELAKKKEIFVPDKDFYVKNKFKNPMVGYGSAASGMVLVNYFNLELEYVIDDNPLKQGKYIPGTNIPIYNSTGITRDYRDLTIFILAYNLFDEIVGKIKELRPFNKDIFIHPLTGQNHG